MTDFTKMTEEQMFAHDDKIFWDEIKIHKENSTIVVLDNGLGDHTVFKHVLPDVKNPVLFTCYPEVIPGNSIADAMRLFGDISRFNIYQWMDSHNWKGSLEDAFRRMYSAEKKR